ncbi:MAG: capsular biosynthesis protein [Methylovulum sp.]|nr:capsular biosynthesis protein [Methylovulum sp.]
MSAEKRSFLFLQGPCSPFFAYLADHLRSLGHTVHKINFSSGDVVYWAPRKAYHFRDELGTLPEFLEALWLKHAITDQVLFGDCRPVHKPAISRAESFGIRTHVFEEGYFRPFWITLEREGVNSHSLLPRDPDWFKAVGKRLPESVKPQAFHSPFSVRATHDVLYNVAGLGNPLFFHRYKGHAPDPAMLEYAGYIRRFLQLKLKKSQDSENIARLLHDKVNFYLLPLQLSSDTQITHHSNFTNMVEVIERVMQSFSHHAPSSAWLVIKIHPLDAGLFNYDKAIRQLAPYYNLTGRVLYLHSGDLNALLKYADGTVTVNSTVGGLALSLNCPTIALADPIYNLPGLTFQGGLDAFWTGAEKPDAELFRCYSKAVIHTTQINGGFYCRQGIALAIKHADRFLDTDKSPLEAFL